MEDTMTIELCFVIVWIFFFLQFVNVKSYIKQVFK